MCIERDAINGVSREEEALRRQINFSELMGGEPNVLPVESIEVIEKEDRRGTVDLKGTNENIGEVALPQKVLNGELGLDPATLGGPGTGSPFPKTGPKFNSKEGELALGSKEAVGLAVHEVGRNFESPLAGILSWADRVKLNVGPLDLRLNHVEGNNDDSDGNFSVDCEVIKGRKRKGKARMFGLGDKAACGGVLVTKGGVIRALFSSLMVNAGSVPFDLCVVKAAFETFKKAGWASRTALTIELVNRSLINRLENSLQRPWNSAKYFAEIDFLIRGCVFVQFKLADSPNLAMASCLAFDGLS
ncbi:hypothetical protein V6N11_018128 [Hibiscus sabdariffa]|uniref:RNase H type-1 domain-containing protein n=2 Tax=Hibiscus sabdariffa TaxID=183260 RepID=A0ABR2T6G3_9ROSI